MIYLNMSYLNLDQDLSIASVDALDKQLEDDEEGIFNQKMDIGKFILT